MQDLTPLERNLVYWLVRDNARRERERSDRMHARPKGSHTDSALAAAHQLAVRWEVIELKLDDGSPAPRPAADSPLAVAARGLGDLPIGSYDHGEDDARDDD